MCECAVCECAVCAFRSEIVAYQSLSCSFSVLTGSACAAIKTTKILSVLITSFS